jgi:hypothetical protein
MKPIFLILLFATQFSFAQSDKKILKDIKKTVSFLAESIYTSDIWPFVYLN